MHSSAAKFTHKQELVAINCGMASAMLQLMATNSCFFAILDAHFPMQ